MHLYLTKRSHLSSTYTDGDGQILYKVENKFFNRVTTIKRALPRDIHTHPRSSREESAPPDEAISDNDIRGDVDENDDAEASEDPALRYRFGHLAEIKFNTITSSTIRYHGEEHETGKFFTKNGLGWNGCNWVFTGPDGLEYQWILGFRALELVRKDVARTRVARFHRRRLGIIGKRRPASLEIFQEGMHMVDLIVITFVYIRRRRNDSGNAAH
ncbi:hypothetical protein AX15_000241 [Amanita polypyramis BW_CC]|nr:hypothetical protein AX15_000241 [Amanita polypyramis BW_CC]